MMMSEEKIDPIENAASASQQLDDVGAYIDLATEKLKRLDVELQRIHRMGAPITMPTRKRLLGRVLDARCELSNAYARLRDEVAPMIERIPMRPRRPGEK